MSRINRIRIVNLNYNNNAIRIDDECFELVNENTLLSLRNGGGKSVLIQMLTAPFVHKRYRDTSDRPFASYFTTNQPTFILVEWSLDHEAGYVLTGMMVRKNQELKEDEDHRFDLEMINFIHEYTSENDYDIQNFPLLIQESQRKTLKGFHVCRQLFEQCKQDKQLKFDYYDMNQPARSRAYFNKLEEFQIYYKEWESIIKKVNLKESGLSELFKDAKDEKGLTEKWFLEAIENKLNQQQDRMKNFETLIKKYILQYQANEGNFKKKEGILRFQEEMQPILELEKQLLENETQVHEYECQLAKLYAILDVLHQETTQAKEQQNQQLEQLTQQQHRLAYEQQSLVIYDLMDQITTLLKETGEQEHRLTQLEERQQITVRQQHIYEAANRYQSYKQASEDVQRCESELAVAKKSQEDLLPRLQNLGYSLSLAYEQQVEREQADLTHVRWQIKDVMQQQKHIHKQLEIKQEDRQQFSTQIGRLEQAISQFDQDEQRLSSKYDEAIQRNLEGFYAAGLLKETIDSIKHQLGELKKQKKQDLEQELHVKELQHKVNRDSEDAKEALGSLKMMINAHQQELKQLEEELKVRHRIRSYIAWPEEAVLDTDGMIEALHQKRQTVEGRLREFEREMDRLQKEKQQLQSGEVLPIPDDLKQRLADEGIQYIPGIDWLKRNQRSAEENQLLISKNPFLPYSLILNATEMKRLKRIDLQIKTPFPVPMILREQLEQAPATTYLSGYCQLDTLHFYVWFNEELLDEHRLQQLLLLKEKEIAEIQDKCATQRLHLERYEEQIGVLKYQKLSATTYDHAKKQLSDSLTQQDELQQQLLHFQAEKERLRGELDAILKQLTTRQEQIHFTQLKLQDFEQFIIAYERYVQFLKELLDVREQLNTTLSEIDEAMQQQAELHESYDRLKASEREKQARLSQSQAVLQRFEHYEEGEELRKDVEDLLAEYEAIKDQLDGVLHRSEEDLISAKKRFNFEEEQLHTLMQRYELSDADYQHITYDKFAHEEVLHEIERLTHELREQEKVINELKISVAKYETEKKNAYDLLKRDLGETEILDKSEVVKRDFMTLLSQNQAQIKTVKQCLHTLEQSLALYAREQSNLVEYNQELPETDVVIDSSYRSYDEKAWQTERGTLLRDYRQQQKMVETLKHSISDEFNRMSRLPLFEEDFFNRPLQRFAVCKHVPQSFIEQYDTMHQVFNSLMKKLDVDIEMSEKEKSNVIQLLLDYVGEIHKQLGLIDQNSSIPIRGKNIKMLRIKLPDWQSNANVYHVRMNDFVNSLTQHCLQLMQNNENIEEFIGHQVTTKQLYDQIVGTSNVEIKLYKIEEQREYQITWEQVAKNSGGEGFLSAFVILTSLLSFMRRDETDIFSSFEEGKVLLMDNPFAQTNAAHLLKPLIELAKKNNTQLICLSGLGGDSIYSRFENIYSLSLVPSSFKKGCEYLKSQHIKGEVEPHLVIPSRVYVEDAVQEALLF